jgi:type II secretory pathway pseudopilin PulG
MATNGSYIPNMFDGSQVSKIDQTPNSPQFSQQYPQAAQDCQQAQQRYANQGPYQSPREDPSVQQNYQPPNQGSPLSYGNNYPSQQAPAVQASTESISPYQGGGDYQQQQQPQQQHYTQGSGGGNSSTGLLSSALNNNIPNSGIENNIQSTSANDKPWRLFF